MKLNITRETFESKRSRKAQKNVQPVREKAEANCVGTYAPASCIEMSEKNIAFFGTPVGQRQLARIDSKIERERERKAARKQAIEALVLNERTREYLLNTDWATLSESAKKNVEAFLAVGDKGRYAIADYNWAVYHHDCELRDMLVPLVKQAAEDQTIESLYDGQRWSFGEVVNVCNKLCKLLNLKAKEAHVSWEQAAYKKVAESFDVHRRVDNSKTPGLDTARSIMAKLNRGTYVVKDGRGIVVGRI